MPGSLMTPELVAQSPAFLLEVGPFLSPGLCEPGIQQEECLTLECPSEHMAKPWLSFQLVSCVPDASTPLALQRAVQFSCRRMGVVGSGEQHCKPSPTSYILSQGDRHVPCQRKRTPTKLWLNGRGLAELMKCHLVPGVLPGEVALLMERG